MKTKLPLLLIIIFSAFCSFAQTSFIVKGVIVNAKSNEPLIGAQVFVENANKGAFTNSKGAFTLDLKKGVHTFEYSYLGYATQTLKLKLNSDTSLFINLIPSSIQLQTVQVTTDKKDKNVSAIDVDKTELSQQGLQAIPAVMGEPDIIRALATKGGVKQVEGVQGMSVRGGSQDQNLILFDKAVVYNPSHLLGFFSVFPSEIVGRASLYKSSIPSQYGGRLSSVLDIESSIPRKDSIEASLSLGVLSSRTSLSVPLDDKSAFRVSYRKTYLDLFVMPIINELMQNSEQLNTKFGFSDASFRYNYKADENNTFNISSYFGRDKFTMNNSITTLQNNVEWGNDVVSAWWTHKHKQKSIQSFGYSQSNYVFDFSAHQNFYDIYILTSIKNNKFFFHNKLLGADYKLNYGAELNKTDYNSGTFKAIINGDEITQIKPLLSHTIDLALFAEGEYAFSDKLSAKFIIRIVPHAQIGPNTDYTYNDENIITDSTVYSWNSVLYSKLGWEPRVQANYSLNSSSSLKAAISRTNQYIHKVSMLSAALPADIWMPVTQQTPAPYGMSYSVGYFKNFESNTYESSFSLFYKSMNNLVEFKDGFITLYSAGIDEKLAQGSGFASGAEVALKKIKGKLQGSLTYSFSRTLRKFKEINDNAFYPAAYDKPHDFSSQIQYTFNSRFSASALFVWSSGKVYSEPTSRYFINKNLINEYGPLNNSRMPNYHRLDIGLDYILLKQNSFNLHVQLSAYNAYNRNNSYYIFYETIGDLDKFSLDMNKTFVGLFPILPSLSILMKLR